MFDSLVMALLVLTTKWLTRTALPITRLVLLLTTKADKPKTLNRGKVKGRQKVRSYANSNESRATSKGQKPRNKQIQNQKIRT